VAHTCNPSYSGGRDQEDHGSKSARANSSTRPYLEKPFTKIGLVEWLKVKALSSSPSTTKNKTKQNSFVPRKRLKKLFCEIHKIMKGNIALCLIDKISI
jgi:hypothetical protein